MLEIITTYLQNLQNISPNDKELQYRPELKIFLESLCQILATQDKTLESIHIHHEPKNDKEGRGAPDFLIQRQGLNIGYIENKRVNYDLDSLAQDPQIQKYMHLSKNIMLTDYLRFALLYQDDKGNIAITQEVRICELSQIKTTLKNKALLESKAKELERLFTRFFTREPDLNTARESANALALRAQILKDELIKNSQNPYISSVYGIFKRELYENLEFMLFADSFAQTLTYSLFLAGLNNISSEKITLYNVESFIQSFPLVAEMSSYLTKIYKIDSIKSLIDEILYIINHINYAKIEIEFNQANQKDLLERNTIHFTHKDPYLHFYETFLSQYDPHLREVRGVYYTPLSIVKFIINAIDLSLKKDFGKKGLKSAITDKNITLLDFSTGTGTFLLEAFEKVFKDIPEESAHYNPNNLLEQFFGFEFLIAPYVMAHLRISEAFKKVFKTPLKKPLRIILTNTLYDSPNERNLFNSTNPQFAAESDLAKAIKKEPILIITGNPPYNGASANKGIYEHEVKISYGLEPSLATLSNEEKNQVRSYFLNKDKNDLKHLNKIFQKHKLQNEKSTKWLLDDYVKFIRFAESKIQKQGSGIFAFISNNSFLDNPTFRGMRYHLLRTFDKLYILDLHGNARKKETTPSGEKDDNVFDIMQGVSINIFIKSGNSSLTQDTRIANKLNKTESKKSKNKRLDTSALLQYDNLAKIYHYDVYGKRKEKYNFLYENTLDSIPWQELKPQNPFYLFIPQNESLRAEYDTGWSVKDIFKVSGVGITTAHDGFVIDSSKEKLLQKFQNFKDSAPNKNELHSKFNVAKKQGWDILKGWQNLQGEDNLEKYIQKISYRPFDTRFIFYEDKLVWRCVKDVMQHFLHDFENVGLVYKRGFPNTDSGQSFVADSMIDFRSWSCSGMQGGDYISPLYIKIKDSKNIESSVKEKEQDQTKWVENFTKEFRAFIDSKYQWEQSDYENNRGFFINSKIFDEKCGLQETSQGSYLEGNDCRDFSPLPHLSQKAEFILSPEAILGYIYAVLFHKEYREKYIDFLKIDFPKIPFTESKETFLALSALGFELLQTHLLQDSMSGYERERERERERTGANENESQYWAKCGTAIQGERGLAMRDSDQHNNRFLPYGWGQHRGWSDIPPLSLQGGLMKNVALICDRGSKLSYIDNIFIADSIIDLHVVGSGSYAFPLYIKE